MPRASRSVKKTASKIRIARPDNFIDDKSTIDNPPEIIPLADLTEYNLETQNIYAKFAEHVEWLRVQRATCMEIARNHGVKMTIPRNSSFRSLDVYQDRKVKEEPVNESVASPKPARNPLPAPMDAEMPEAAPVDDPDEETNMENIVQHTPRTRPVLRQSQIKDEVVTPVEQAPPVPTPRSRPIPLAKPTTPVAPARVSPVKKPKVENPTPVQVNHTGETPVKKEEPRKVRAATRTRAKPNNLPVPITLPVPGKTKEKVKNFDAQMKNAEEKLRAAEERKHQAMLEKKEKSRKDREEKERRVKENQEQQRRELEKKAEERRRLEEAQEEYRRLQLVTKSPARSRLASAMSTPIRQRPASPARNVLPHTPNVASVRARLFASPATHRTPGRPNAKLQRIEQIRQEGVRGSPLHPSPMREVPRKIPSGSRKEHVKEEQTAQSRPAMGIVSEEERQQLLLMMGGASISAEVKDEEEKRVKLEEDRVKREEDGAKKRGREEDEAKRRRREEERRAAEEEARRREAIRQKEQEQARRLEEERKRLEEQQRLAKEQEERERAAREAMQCELNTTFDMDTSVLAEEDNRSTYDMTQEKVFQPASAENYNIHDISSGDETDDEGAPRKDVPAWAQWKVLYRTAADQYKNFRNMDYEDMFGTMELPEEQKIFNEDRTKRRPRGSSAHWSSPATNPTKGKSRFLGY